MSLEIKNFHDKNTGTLSYIVFDQKNKISAIIDPVLDYDIYSGSTETKSADQIIQFIRENNLENQWILETHIHADHLTSANYIKEKIGGKIAIGEGIYKVLKFWVKFFNLSDEYLLNGKQFDKIFKDDENFKIGNLNVKFITTPGHTPACGCYLIEDNLFVGDLVFMPESGTGRTDFPAGSAADMFDSIQKIFRLGDKIKIFTCHDYPEEGGNPRYQSTIGEERLTNKFAKIENRDEFIKKRQERDKNLSVPKLLLPSIQININCGKFPKKEDNEVAYLKIPLNAIS